MESFDELLKRDEQREKDGFPRKIKIRRILAGPKKVISVPYVEEEKLIHGDFEPTGEHGEDLAGHGKGEVGDIIAEIPLSGGEGDGDGDGDDEDDSGQAGDGEGEHGAEAEAYQLGKELSEKFQLPNLKDKSKKVPTNEYVYDLTDRHRGSGQLLDKKATLKRIVKSNIALGRLDIKKVDTSKFVVGPQDKIYRILAMEKVWKSPAMIFFVRDYSGSMSGDPTQAILNQHLMLYATILFQYEKLVTPRFILHDTEAREVTARVYFSARSGGGTFIPAAYKKINEIVDGEGLAKNFNIYVFQGTDGDDADDGEIAIPEIEEILTYTNRMGVTLFKGSDRETSFEEYIEIGGFSDRKHIFRMFTMPNRNVSDEQNEEAIKKLLAQD
ncbi:MAG: DUF444 family protein [Candidatus Yanofskybacteria bacterium]|nr:DUF444 family protein [Candidatus Yanofskybacteria bacterium]